MPNVTLSETIFLCIIQYYILAGRPPGTHSSYSVETIPSAPLELREYQYTLNVVHQAAGTRDTCQVGGTEPLQYGQGPIHGM